MTHLEIAQPLIGYERRVCDARPGRGEDRATVIRLPDRMVFVLADGAGGVAGGAAAASKICAYVDDSSKIMWGVTDWVQRLRTIDRILLSSSGLAAAIVAEVFYDGVISGASVGDCEAWLFRDGAPRHLTVGQYKTPLLGSGDAVPVGFSSRLDGRLVFGSDGLWKYMSRTRIAETVGVGTLDAAVETLVAGVRLRSGALQDDVSILMCEL